jgi:hypothetical protein
LADSCQMMCPLCTFQSTHLLGPAHPLALPRLWLIPIHQLRLPRLSAARGVTFLLLHHRKLPALPLALYSLERVPRHPRLSPHPHPSRVSPQYQLGISTMSLINISAPHRS